MIPGRTRPLPRCAQACEPLIVASRGHPNEVVNCVLLLASGQPPLLLEVEHRGIEVGQGIQSHWSSGWSLSQFRSWVTSEVLPVIRRSRSYSTLGAPPVGPAER